MSIGPADKPVPDKGVRKPPNRGIRDARRHDAAEEVCDLRRSRPAVVLVLFRRSNPKRLAEILLMHADDVAPAGDPVVSIHDDGALM